MARVIDISNYFPDVLYPAKEFQALATAENPEFKLSYELCLKWFDNGFVFTLDKDGAQRWEDMLRLTAKASDTLEQRRQRILAKLRSMLPYTHRRLEEILAANFGENMTTLDIRYNDYLLNIDIDKSIVLQREALFYLVRAIVPANMSIMVRYTKEAEHNIYFCAVVGSRKRMRITTAAGYTLTNAEVAGHFVGVVGARKRMKVQVII